MKLITTATSSKRTINRITEHPAGFESQPQQSLSERFQGHTLYRCLCEGHKYGYWYGWLPDSEVICPEDMTSKEGSKDQVSD